MKERVFQQAAAILTHYSTTNATVYDWEDFLNKLCEDAWGVADRRPYNAEVISRSPSITRFTPLPATTAGTSVTGRVAMGQALAGRLLNMQPYSTPSLPRPLSHLPPFPHLPRRPPLAVVCPRRASLAPVNQELDELEGGVMLRSAPVPSVSAFEFLLCIFAVPALVVLVVSLVAFLLAFHVIGTSRSSVVYLW
ncbi:hypothetical protein EDD16DRAFT_1703892 [Pisolithus croceorrhizus]|nr:hypothetical protein EDD16DRAFT_1703892 [Pisolithus croceorrhizus]